MPEATKQFVPTQSRSNYVYVGRAPGLREDPTTSKVFNFAQKLNLDNIKNQRAQMYLEGQIEAAQGKGVADVREDQSGIETLFGGGATLSGAMDYTEKAKILEYQEYLSNNMGELRTQRPEQFKQDQMDQIQQFLTDDSETNERIMNTFALAIPEVARMQAKEHTAYVKERQIQAMSQAAQAGLTHFNTIQQTGSQEAIQSAYTSLAETLMKPENMTDAAYKGWLYDILPVAASNGNPIVSQLLQEQGLVSTAGDIEALSKADEELVKYTAEQETVQFGIVRHQLELFAENPATTPGELINAITGARDQLGKTGNKHFTSAIVNDLLDRNFEAVNKESKVEDYTSYMELFYSGQSEQIPAKHVQKTYQLVSAKLATLAQNGEWEEYDKFMRQTINGYKYATKKNNVMAQRWKSSLVAPVKETPSGFMQVTERAQQTIQELDMWNEEAPNVISRQLDGETAALYEAYKTEERSRPEGSQEEWLSDALRVMERRETVDRRTTEEGTQAVMDEVFDRDDFNEDAVATSMTFAGELKSVSEYFALKYDDPKIAAAEVNAYMHKNWEMIDDIIFPKVDGKTLAERTGSPTPIKTLRGVVRDGRIEGWGDVRISTEGSHDLFILRDAENPDNMVKVPFYEVEERYAALERWKEPREITATQEKRRKSLLKDADKALLIKFRQDIRDLPYGEFRTTPTNAAETKLENMTDEEKINAYEQLLEEQEALKGTGTLSKVGKWIAGMVPEGYDPDNPPPGMGSLAVVVGKWLGYSREREQKRIESAKQALEIEKGPEASPEQEPELETKQPEQEPELETKQPEQETTSVASVEVTQLAKDEGFRGSPYTDSEGHRTVGHGFNIEPDAIHPIVKRRLQGVEYPISEKLSESILEELVSTTEQQIQEDFPDQPDEVKRILLNMQYQIGYAGLRKFRKTLAAIRERDYQTASEEMLDSKWAKQTPNRARRLAERMAAI